jgi:hypothetical protein
MIYGTLMDVSTRKANELYQLRRAEEAMETKRQQEYFIDMVSNSLLREMPLIFSDHVDRALLPRRRHPMR